MCTVLIRASSASSARARAEGCDVVIVDTAGRLHNKSHLMAELAKVRRVIDQARVEEIESLFEQAVHEGQASGLSAERPAVEGRGLGDVSRRSDASDR